MRSGRFWTMMVLFQLVFGLTVFGLTRQYYIDERVHGVAGGQPVAGAQPVAPHPLDGDWAGGAGSGDLAGLISAFPGQTATLDPVELSRQADALFMEEQYAQAAHLYERALKGGSQDVNDYNSLGLTLFYLGRSQQALAVLDEGVVVDPAYQRIWLTLGFVNSQVGNEGAARRALTRAVELDPASDVGQSAAAMLANLAETP